VGGGGRSEDESKGNPKTKGERCGWENQTSVGSWRNAIRVGCKDMQSSIRGSYTNEEGWAYGDGGGGWTPPSSTSSSTRGGAMIPYSAVSEALAKGRPKTRTLVNGFAVLVVLTSSNSSTGSGRSRVRKTFDCY